MERKVAMAMVAAMAVGSLAVPVMAEDGAAGGKIGISMLHSLWSVGIVMVPICRNSSKMLDTK